MAAYNHVCRKKSDFTSLKKQAGKQKQKLTQKIVDLELVYRLLPKKNTNGFAG